VSTAQAPGALDGVRVLELSELIAAPLGGMLLGDMGADVIKVEPPGGESGRLTVRSAMTETRGFMALNRNKRALAVDLKTAEGREVVHRLVPTVDVVIVNYRPETAEALGIDYETLQALHPGLIYVDNTATGSRGPEVGRPGYDIILQAMSGLMAAGGRAESGIPLPINPPVADLATGVVIAWAVCAALFARDRRGVGQRVETTLLGTSLLLQSMQFLRPLDPDNPAAPPPERDWTVLDYPYYRTWATADGMVSVAAVTPALRRRFEDAVGVHHPLHSQRHVPRDGPEAAALTQGFLAGVADVMAGRTTREWLEVFDEAAVPAGPYRLVDELADDPQVRANDLAVDVRHPTVGEVTMVGPVVRMTDTPTAVRRPPPTVGQHSLEILRELGYPPAEVDRLVGQGVIATPSDAGGADAE
jgi:crotonobetainyl-CoA:carnitine CoA-transferase CaiB-like acyl-CoA transferase